MTDFIAYFYMLNNILFSLSVATLNGSDKVLQKIDTCKPIKSLINEKKNNKHCLLDTSRTVMVNKQNYCRDYKGHTKWLSLINSHFAKKGLFGMTLLQHMLIISVLYVQSIRKLQ